MQILKSSSKLYKCKCQNILISSENLSKHIKIPKTHKISLVCKEILNESQKISKLKTSKHIKSLRLFSDKQNNWINLYLVFAITRMNLDIDILQKFIQKSSISLETNKHKLNKYIKTEQLKCLELKKIEKIIEKLKIIEITAFKYFKAATLSKF